MSEKVSDQPSVEVTVVIIRMDKYEMKSLVSFVVGTFKYWNIPVAL